MNRLRVEDDFRPQIKAALRGIKTRFRARATDENSASRRLLRAFPSSVSITTTPSSTYRPKVDIGTPQEAIVKHAERMRDAARARKALRAATSLRYEISSSSSSSTPSHMTRSTSSKQQQRPPTDVELRSEVNAVLRKLDLKPPETFSSSYAPPSSSLPPRRRVVRYDDPDVVSEVRAIVDRAEKEERRAARLEARGRSPVNTLKHANTRAPPDADAARLHGYVEKIDRLRSKSVAVRRQLERPLRRSYRDDASAREMKSDKSCPSELAPRLPLPRDVGLSEAGRAAVETERRRKARARAKQAEREERVRKIQESARGGHFLRATDTTEMHRRHDAARETPKRLHNICLKHIKSIVTNADGTYDLSRLVDQMAEYGVTSDVPVADLDDDGADAALRIVADRMVDGYVQRERAHVRRVHDLH